MTPKKKQTVPVSERALVQRINRKLAGKQLVKTRGIWALPELGRYYTVSDRNTIVDTHVALEGFGRKLHVLQPWESLVKAK